MEICHTDSLSHIHSLATHIQWYQNAIWTKINKNFFFKGKKTRETHIHNADSREHKFRFYYHYFFSTTSHLLFLFPSSIVLLWLLSKRSRNLLIFCICVMFIDRRRSDASETENIIEKLKWEKIWKNLWKKLKFFNIKTKC